MNRRTFLLGASTLGVASAFALPGRAASDPPPETTRIRLTHFPAICTTPKYLAEEFLRMEGFTNVEYVDLAVNTTTPLVDTGVVDMDFEAAPRLVAALDVQKNIVALGGVHAGCYELFGNERVRAIRDLKGKTVSISAFGSGEHVFVSSIVAYVGMDPTRDINWVVTGDVGETMRLFVDGKVDAFLGFAPQPQELRAKKIGHVILNTTQDRPWSNYFCCMVVANRQFVQSNPVAAKRALRAILKAADVCAEQPEKAARYLQVKGYEPRYELSLEVLRQLPYRRWREASPEDTLRFHALRLHEVGMIKTSPQKLIAQGTDWRFFNELKQELKA
jgi:NitT/TauT family transport system substrate-binding protein